MLSRLVIAGLILAFSGMAPSVAQAQPTQSQTDGQTGLAAQSPQEPIDKLFEAWRMLDTRLYLAQWVPDAIKIDKRSGARQDTAALLADRAKLFAQLAGVDVTYNPTVIETTDFEARVHVAYTMRFRFKSGRAVSESACETYRLQNRGGTWLIVENVDYDSCDMTRSVAQERRAGDFDTMSCDELWHARNSIYARFGFCFKQERSIAVFGRACFPPYGQLPPEIQGRVNVIVGLERRHGCPQ